MKEVSLRECSNYDYDNVKRAVSLSLMDLGGLAAYIKPKSKVVVKANLLMKKKPEEVATTHPMLIKVICEELQKLNCQVIIADSPGGPYSASALKSVYKTCGMEDVAKELNVALNYDTTEVKVENPDGYILKYLNVIKPIVDADYVINVCKLKTHVLTTVTGGVKNLFGVIPGTSKAEYHLKMPRITDFTNALVDICEYVKPTITIMDGIIGMEGEGPSAGTPRKVGVILASSNTYALDAVACKLINLNPKNAPIVKRTMERGYIKEDLSDINILGANIENKIVRDYIIPKSKGENPLEGRVPKFITSAITPKPVVKVKTCVGCKKCQEVCPAKAIDMISDKPKFNLDKCIRCYCCHELCPKKAIDVKRPFIFKIIK